MNEAKIKALAGGFVMVAIGVYVLLKAIDVAINIM